MLTKCDAPLIVDTENSTEMWCVFQHEVTMKEGEPPSIILIGACRLIDVYRLIDGKTNSEWQKMFENGGQVLVRAVAVCNDRTEAFQYAGRLMQTGATAPHCNLYGYNSGNAARRVICLNSGKVYDSQKAAGEDLGIPQSTISRHLRGHLSQAGGMKFAYAVRGEQ